MTTKIDPDKLHEELYDTYCKKYLTPAIQAFMDGEDPPAVADDAVIQCFMKKAGLTEDDAMEAYAEVRNELRLELLNVLEALP